MDFSRKLLPHGELALFTNGSLLTDDLIHKFRSLDIKLAISLQGLKSYKSMTGSKHDVRDILEKLRRCRECEYSAEVSIVVTQLNRHEICDIFAAAADAGVRFIQLGPMMLQGRGRERIDLALSREEWEEVKSQIRNMKNCNTPYTFCEEMLCRCQKNPVALQQSFGLSNPFTCNAGKRFGVISPSGSYRKCLHYLEMP